MCLLLHLWVKSWCSCRWWDPLVNMQPKPACQTRFPESLHCVTWCKRERWSRREGLSGPFHHSGPCTCSGPLESILSLFIKAKLAGLLVLLITSRAPWLAHLRGNNVTPRYIDLFSDYLPVHMPVLSAGVHSRRESWALLLPRGRVLWAPFPFPGFAAGSAPSTAVLGECSLGPSPKLNVALSLMTVHLTLKTVN